MQWGFSSPKRRNKDMIVFFRWNLSILIFWISTFSVGGINCFLRTTGLGNTLFRVSGGAWEERFGSVCSTTISIMTWFGCIAAKFWVTSGPTTLPTKAFYIIWFVVFRTIRLGEAGIWIHQTQPKSLSLVTAFLISNTIHDFAKLPSWGSFVRYGWNGVPHGARVSGRDRRGSVYVVGEGGGVEGQPTE